MLLGDDIMRAKKPVTLQLVEAAEKYGASAVGVQQVATEAISRYSLREGLPPGGADF